MLLALRFLRNPPLRSLFFTAVALGLPGCPAPADCPGGFVGDRGGAPELVPGQLSLVASERLLPLKAGDEVDLVRPIQGGHVVFAGAFVRNVAGCGTLRGELRRDQAGQPGAILVYDERTTELGPPAPGEPVPSGAGWGRTPLSINDVANVPACPNTLPDDLVDAPVWLKLTYTEPGGRATSAQVRVAPRCRQAGGAQAACRCECLANYTIDRCLQQDAGF